MIANKVNCRNMAGEELDESSDDDSFGALLGEDTIGDSLVAILGAFEDFVTDKIEGK